LLFYQRNNICHGSLGQYGTGEVIVHVVLPWFPFCHLLIIVVLARHGLFCGWLTEHGPEAELRTISLIDCICLYDHSPAVMIVVHFW
jgi:hypothetical protein